MTKQQTLKAGVVMAALALAGALALFVFGAFQPVAAQTTDSDVTRSLGAPQTAADGVVSVDATITLNNGTVVSVTETLPAGWAYKANSARAGSTPIGDDAVTVTGQMVSFVLTNLSPITYTATAPSGTTGMVRFSGTYSVTGGATDVTIGGDTTVNVLAPGTTPTPTTPPTPPESAALTTDKASSATRLTVMGSGMQLGNVGPNDEVVINLEKFGLPGTIAEADVTIDDGSHTANPQSVSVSGSNITLLLGKFDANLPNDNPANVINADDSKITIIIRDRAGITTPTKAGMYEVKVDAKDAKDAKDTYDLAGEKMMVPIIRSISVSPASAARGTDITITGKGFTDGSAAVTAMAAGMKGAESVSIGAADIVSGSFTLTVNNNLKVNNVSAFGKGAAGTDIQATDGTGATAAAAANHMIKAAFSISPESPNPGQEVTITLADTDVTANSDVMVSFAGGKAIPADMGSEDTSWTVNVPSDVRRGTIQMSVTVDKAAALTMNITIATNPLTVTPSTVVPGQVISVTGTGFKGASTIAIGGVKIGSIAANNAELLVNNIGSVTFDVSVPAGVAAGDAKVEVTDSAGRVGEATITVSKAALALDPEESLIGSDVMVSGTGFPANDLVLIKYDGNTLTTANTDSEGMFSKGIVVPSGEISTGGSYTVLAESQINAVKVSASKTHKTPKPTITLSGETATAGSSLTIDGANFKGFVQVHRIEIGTQNVTTLPTPATDKWGTFSATVQVPQLSPGRYAVKAIVEDANGDSATEFLQVVEEVVVVSTAPADVFAEIGDRLSRVWYLDRESQEWSFYDPDPELADFNTLSEVKSGQVVQVIVTAGDTIEFQGTTLYAGTNPIALD